MLTEKETNQATFDEIKAKAAALSELHAKRQILVNELNALASTISYGNADYDSETYWRNEFFEIAYQSDLSFGGHRPGSEYSFWIPSSTIC